MLSALASAIGNTRRIQLKRGWTEPAIIWTAIVGGVQPGILDRVLGYEHRESGLLARLLLAMPPHRKKHWTGADIPASVEAAIRAIFDRLYELQPNHDDDGDPRSRIVKLTSEGKAAWMDFYNAHAEEHAELTGDLSAAWSKLEGYAARLALVVHLVRWTADGPTLQNPDAVDETSITAGVTLSRWFGREARRVYGILAESDEDRDRRRLTEWIGRRGGSITVRDLTHGMRQHRGNAEAARAALDTLKKGGFGRWTHAAPGPEGGRTSPQFELVSGVTVTETPLAMLRTAVSVPVTLGTRRKARRPAIPPVASATRTLAARSMREYLTMFASPTSPRWTPWTAKAWAGRFDRETLRVYARKTGASRTVPMLPALRDELLKTFERCPERGEFVIQRRQPLPPIRRAVELAIEHAGLTAWPRLFQQLRASFATDCVRTLPANVAAAILGHSARIAAEHYWITEAEDLDRAGRALRTALPCSALQKAVQHSAADDCTTPRDEKAENDKVASRNEMRKDATSRECCDLAPMGAGGFEPP